MRRIALRACAGLFAVSWIVLPGFGAIDLVVTWSANWPQALEAGWGLFATIIVGAPFLSVAVRPRVTASAVVQLAVAALALALSAVVAEETGLFWFASALVAQTVIVRLLAGRFETRALRPQLSRPFLLLGALGVLPWLVYAEQMWALNREGRANADITIGVDHYSMQGALGLSVALLPLLAAAQPSSRPFVAICAGVAAFYLALISVAWPDAAGGLTETWSVAAALWGLALVAAASVRRLGSLPGAGLVAALTFATAGVFWLGVWWHQRVAHGQTSVNEENLVLGLTWMDSGKLLLLPLALFFVAIVALYLSTPEPARPVGVAFAGTAISLAALATGTVLEFWRFEWGSYEQRFEDVEIGLGGALQALSAVGLGVASTAFGIALSRRRVLPAWIVPALPIAALAMFWLTPTSPLPGLAWIVLGGVVSARATPVSAYRRPNAEGAPMYEIFTFGRFEVDPANEAAFIEAWSEFAKWASQNGGAQVIRLARDVRNPGRLISLGQWDDAEAVRRWKSSPEFKERLGRVVRHATEFEPTELVTLARFTGGTLELHTPPADIEAIHAPG